MDRDDLIQIVSDAMSDALDEGVGVHQLAIVAVDAMLAAEAQERIEIEAMLRSATHGA